jgi:hypothetical protein
MYLLPIKGKDKKDSAQFDQDFYSAYIMSEKKPQLKRKAISLEKKIQVLDRLDTGKDALAVSNFFDLNEATVRTIKKNQDRIRSSVAAGTAAGSKTREAREVVLEMMEKKQPLSSKFLKKLLFFIIIKQKKKCFFSLGTKPPFLYGVLDSICTNSNYTRFSRSLSLVYLEV